MIDNWISDASWTFFKWFFYVLYNLTIHWLKYTINTLFINNCFSFRVQIKGAQFCFIITFYFLNSKSNIVNNLSPISLVNKSFSLFLITDSVFLSCNFEFKEFKITRFVMFAFFYSFCFIKNVFTFCGFAI